MPEMQQAPQGGDTQSQVAQLIQNVGKGLMMLSQITQKVQGINPEIPQRMEGLVQEFGSIVDALTGGGGQPQQGPSPAPQGAVSSPEAGGNPNARPA